MGAGSRVPILNGTLTVHTSALSAVLGKISRTDASNAARARTQAELGGAAAILLLLVAFEFFYRRSGSARRAVR